MAVVNIANSKHTEIIKLISNEAGKLLDYSEAGRPEMCSTGVINHNLLI